jgi:anti-sigma-K factor RskA
VAYLLAITLELDPAEVVADLEEQREKNPKRKEFWRSFLLRVRTLAVFAVVTLALIFTAGAENEPAQAGGS